MSDKTILRAAKPDDIPAITDCVNQAYKHYVERLGKSPGPMLNDYAKIVQLHHVYVALADDLLVGVLVLMQKDSHMLLDNIAVQPEFQGRGVGSALLDLAEKITRTKRHSYIELYTHELMTENIEMYNAKGYREITRRLEKGYERVYMRKRL